MPNLLLSRHPDPSVFRRLAIGTWRTAYDPSVYGTLELRVDQALGYLEAFRRRTGKKLSLNHLLAKAVGVILTQVPEANAILRFGRVYLRKTVGVFFQVAVPREALDGDSPGAAGGQRTDLSGLTLHDPDKKSLAEIHDEFEAKAALTRSRRDPALEPARRRLSWMPGWLMSFALRTVAFLNYSLNLDLSWAGVPRDAFGSVMITNVGSLGLDIAYAPLVPYSRVPIVIALGAVHDAPVVEDGKLTIAKVMRVNVTFDHRFIDGVHAAKMAQLLRAWFEAPYEHFERPSDVA